VFCLVYITQSEAETISLVVIIMMMMMMIIIIIISTKRTHFIEAEMLYREET